MTVYIPRFLNPGQKNNTLVSRNAGDERSLHLGGRKKKKKLSVQLNFLNKVYT